MDTLCDIWGDEHWNNIAKYTLDNIHKQNSNSKEHKYFVKKVFVENMPLLTDSHRSATFWSLTDIDSSYALRINFYDGYDRVSNKSISSYALCVR